MTAENKQETTQQTQQPQIKRQAGRPKKSEPTLNQDSKEEDTKVLDIKKLQAELAEAKKKLEEKVAKELPGIKLDLYPKQPHVCCLIDAPYENLEAARQAKFYELMDSQGEVILKCPLSGLSVKYRNLTEWPKVNARVPCKEVNSFFVKFSVREKK